MAKIGLSEGFTLIPKGTHVFKIVEVKYNGVFIKTWQSVSVTDWCRNYSMQ